MADPCLNCTLPICDDRSKECAYRLVQIERRKPYFAGYYKANRDKKLAAAKERNAANREAYLEYQRAYKAKKRAERRAA